MDYKKPNMNFIITTSSETRDKLKYEGFTEIPQQVNGTFYFLNDGKKLTFDAEKENCVYTNILHI